MEQDGPTEVTLGLTHDVDPGVLPAFAGTLATPNRAVVVSTVEGEMILETKVPTTNTYVRIWVNRPKEPDRVIIGLE
jgi:hypothetical protein